MWKEGTIGVPSLFTEGKYITCHYWVKVCDDTESGYGIDDGRIIKLMIKIGDEIVCNYDRGWVVKATRYEAMFALELLLHEYN